MARSVGAWAPRRSCCSREAGRRQRRGGCHRWPRVRAFRPPLAAGAPEEAGFFALRVSAATRKGPSPAEMRQCSALLAAAILTEAQLRQPAGLRAALKAWWARPLWEGLRAKAAPWATQVLLEIQWVAAPPVARREPWAQAEARLEAAVLEVRRGLAQVQALRAHSMSRSSQIRWKVGRAGRAPNSTWRADEPTRARLSNPWSYPRGTCCIESEGRPSSSHERSFLVAR